MKAALVRQTTVRSVALGGAMLLLAGGCPTTTQWLVLSGDGGAADTGVNSDAALVCSGTLVSCENECVDLGGNAAHCGGCENECAPGETCLSGNCQCPAGTELCAEACRDTAVDPLHCGGCGQPCEAEEQCVGGICGCRAGLERCNGECVDTRLDSGFCGDCNNDCTGTGTPYCLAGTCSAAACEDQVPAAVTCGSDEVSCVSSQQMQTSPLHCGECDNSCDADEICATGQCQSYYPAAGCTTCPCNDVCGSNLCCTLPGAAVLICLVGATSCP